MRIALLILSSTLALAACSPEPAVGPDGRPIAKVYRISATEAPKIQQRSLETINALRQASGAQPLQLNSSLNNASARHSRDMAQQQRPWHFGSDGSSPIDRATSAGYSGQFLGENISETYETELETIAAWMQDPDTRRVLLDPAARNMGISFYQESTGKIWWTMNTGT